MSGQAGFEAGTLDELVELVAGRTRESGCYAGVTELALREQDPFGWEEALIRLVGATVGAREVAVHIAASPITRSINETCFVLYTPDGDAVCVSTGIIVHVHTMSEDIKYMIRQGYEEFPGIRPGDIFACNDPRLGNVHTTDVHTLVPIFYGEELVGWAGGVTHQIDIGGAVPGHDTTVPTSRFEDGLYITAEKIGERGRLYPHYLERSRSGVRTPLFYDLDEKARIAGCEMIGRVVQPLIEQYGLDYYERFTREVIEFSRRNFLARVRERLVPGRYRAVAWEATPFAEEAWQSHARRDWLHALPMEVEVTSDAVLRIDMDGNGPPGPWPWNCSYGAFEGALWVVLVQMLGYGEVINEGFNLAVETHRPFGTWLNCDHLSHLSRQVPWVLSVPTFTSLYRTLTRSLFARGFVEEGMAGYPATGDATQGGQLVNGRGGEPTGMYGPLTSFDFACTGGGANSARDGIDHGYEMWNPEGDCDDVESWERLELGFRYLARRRKVDIAGPGRRRGGGGLESVRVSYGASGGTVFAHSTSYVHSCSGNFGGYPAGVSYWAQARQTNIQELWDGRRDYPLSDDTRRPDIERTLTAEIERIPRAMTYPRPLAEYDVVVSKTNAGPGCGDPLDRPLALCAGDLDGGFYSLETMARVFGVAAAEEDGVWRVDEAASRARREELRRHRLAESVAFADFYAAERRRLLEGDLIPPVADVYRSLPSVSARWWPELKAFWQLPDDFEVAP